MNIWTISLQNIKSRPLYTVLSILVLSLSIALLLGIQQLKSSFEYQIENNLGDIDLVVGAKGSPLQLVLASVLHLDDPTGNISFQEAMAIGRNPMIEKAVPISYGDNYKGYRIVGTTNLFLSFYRSKLREGHEVKKSMEIVLGHTVAQRLGLQLGDKITSSHGLVDNSIDVHDDEFVVVGILEPTQKVIDRLIITNLESIWDVHDHENHDHDESDHHHDESHEGEHEDHDHEEDHHKDEDDVDDREITSLLITFRNPMGLLTLPRNINENSNMQAALPKFELNRLYDFTGVGLQTISWIAYIILVISGLTIFLSLYKMIKERSFDLALLRTYGASNWQLIKMVSYEGFTIVGIAFALGFLLTNVGLHVITNYLCNSPQQNILQGLAINEALQIIGLVFVMIVFAISLAIYPIIKMNISTILSNEK